MKRYIGSYIDLFDDYDLKMTDVLAKDELEARKLVAQTFNFDISGIDIKSIDDFVEVCNEADVRICVMEVR